MTKFKWPSVFLPLKKDVLVSKGIDSDEGQYVLWPSMFPPLKKDVLVYKGVSPSMYPLSVINNLPSPLVIDEFC